MNNIVGSASKIVFILLALTACVGFIIERLDAKDFMMLAGMAFAFYFSYKGNETSTGVVNEVVEKAPYAGK